MRGKPNQLKDIWKRVKVGKPDECWEWQGRLNTSGYGQMSIRGKLKLAHRLAYEVSKGPIPDGLVVRHSCDNPRCCNPAHLSIGTQADNVRDAHIKGRIGKGVDADTVREIRRSTETIASLGRRFGISDVAAGLIRRGLSHRHVI